MKRGELKRTFNEVSDSITRTAIETARDTQRVEHVVRTLQNPFAVAVIAYKGIKFLVEKIDDQLPVEEGPLLSGESAGDDFFEVLG